MNGYKKVSYFFKNKPFPYTFLWDFVAQINDKMDVF